MTRLFACLLISLLGYALPTVTSAEDTHMTDPRTSLGMTPVERAEFLSEMRKMLGSIQGILQGISTEDRKMIAEFATQSGNRMARATPDSLRNRLPQAFKDIGGPTHLMFEELVVRAETDDMGDLLKHTTDIMGQCMSCHSQFRAD
ncbi:hypothetical protein [Thiothrix winogradskyi]|uniref:Cytochrome c n=1 Tax=Thiothrix winogradskyi TaxID=96472 RepID=A0ABY3T3A9_9GAMM|nr:hypothetical protein [Thiothrix winogradskyi]UJS26346.1 hypothetical protein L2Y54_09985 [Thiothrix winogradskyi]